MKKFGDAVLYVKNGQSFNALVVASRETATGEQLELIYLEDETKLRVHGLPSKAFSVDPFKEGAVSGWKEPVAFEELLARWTSVKSQESSRADRYYRDLVKEYIASYDGPDASESTTGVQETVHYADGSSATVNRASDGDPLPATSPVGSPEVSREVVPRVEYLGLLPTPAPATKEQLDEMNRGVREAINAAHKAQTVADQAQDAADDAPKGQRVEAQEQADDAQGAADDLQEAADAAKEPA